MGDPGDVAHHDDLAGRVADGFRTILERLATRDVPDAELDEIVHVVEGIVERLDHPPRVRWYERGDPSQPRTGASQRAYVDQSPLRGRLNPIAPPMRLSGPVEHEGRYVVEGRVWLHRGYEGPPHGVHGGIVAALFDELLGAGQTLGDGMGGVTARLTVRYRHLTPIEEELVFRAWLEEDRERRLIVKATCHAGDLLTAEAEGLFIRVDFGEVESRMRSRRAADPEGD